MWEKMRQEDEGVNKKRKHRMDYEKKKGMCGKTREGRNEEGVKRQGTTWQMKTKSM